MEIQTRYKVIIVVVTLAGSYAAGRWASPTKVITEIKTVEVEKKTDQTVADVKKQKHKKIVIVASEKPDGQKDSTTTITDDVSSDSNSKTTQVDTENKTVDNKHEEDHPEPKTTIAALAGISTRDGQIQYGAQVYKPILGPFGVGVFGLGNATDGISCGLSVGITF